MKTHIKYLRSINRIILKNEDAFYSAIKLVGKYGVFAEFSPKGIYLEYPYISRLTINPQDNITMHDFIKFMNELAPACHYYNGFFGPTLMEFDIKVKVCNDDDTVNTIPSTIAYYYDIETKNLLLKPLDPVKDKIQELSASEQRIITFEDMKGSIFV